MQPATGIEERQRGPSMSSAAVQSRPEALIRYLLEGTSSQTGQEFFRALVRSVALAMDVAGVWVTEYLPERKVLRSLAFWMNGHYIQDYEYNIAGSVRVLLRLFELFQRAGHLAHALIHEREDSSRLELAVALFLA